MSKTRKHVMKDTISIPSKGFTIIRFKADNPGWWLLHCHYGEKGQILSQNLNNIQFMKFIFRLAFGSWNGSCAAGWRN
jgi:hypothetical protein